LLEAEPQITRVGLAYRQALLGEPCAARNPELTEKLSSGLARTIALFSDQHLPLFASLALGPANDDVVRDDGHEVRARSAPARGEYTPREGGGPAELSANASANDATGDDALASGRPHDLSACLDALCDGATTLVFLGHGGLMRAAKAVAGFAGWSIPGSHMRGQSWRPRTRFIDRYDARVIDALLLSNDISKLRFVILGGSEDRRETRLLAVSVLEALRQTGYGATLHERVLCIVPENEPGRARSGLAALAAAHALPTLTQPPHIADTRAIFSPGVQLAALARGLDVAAYRGGGRALLRHIQDSRTERCRPFIGALTNLVAGGGWPASERVLAYDEHLEELAVWWSRLSPLAADAGRGAQAPTSARRLTSVLRLEPASISLRVAGDLARLADVEDHANTRIGDSAWSFGQERLTALASGPGIARTLTLERLDAAILGQIMMHGVVESILIEGCLAAS